MGIKLKQLLLESRLDKLYKELKDHVHYYKIALNANNEWQMKEEIRIIRMLADEIKNEKGKSPEQLDQDRFLRHHYTGFIRSDAYKQYEKEGGLGWLGKKSKYPIVLTQGGFGPYSVEFRTSGEESRYVKDNDKGDIMRDEKGEPIYMSADEIKAAGLPALDTTIVAYVEDKPIGLASNEFGAVGIWVEGPYQKFGIGTALLEMHLDMRPRVKTGKSKIGQSTNAGLNLMRAYHRKMVKKHGPEWFKQISGKDD